MKKSIFYTFLTLIGLFVLFLSGVIPFKKQELTIQGESQSYRYYSDFMHALASQHPIGSDESDIRKFWENQEIDTSPYTTEPILDSDHKEGKIHYVTYEFEKLFSESCFLSRGSGKRERLAYKFSKEGKLLSVSFINSCGGRLYK